MMEPATASGITTADLRPHCRRYALSEDEDQTQGQARGSFGRSQSSPKTFYKLSLFCIRMEANYPKSR
jgi:hypothetical protein